MQVLPIEIESIRGNEVLFRDGKSLTFDSIIFCTGFKRTTQKWLKVCIIFILIYLLYMPSVIYLLLVSRDKR